MPQLRLLYSSESKLRDGVQTVAEQVAQLAQLSARRNAQNGITGALLFINEKFLQVIEGDADAVENTFEHVCRSFRHENIKLIDLMPIEQRMFADWNMALLGTGMPASTDLQGEFEHVRLMAGVNARTAVELMLKSVSQATAQGVLRTDGVEGRL